MYTQCPDCSTAFRVTAEVLKQAAGKVRCGGCGNAFNALKYLSETMPERPASKRSEAPLPELKPEPSRPPKSDPTTISAEESAALLKTLDELAGSDIRIEDTGAEWRVLDDEASAQGPVAGKAAAGVDEILDESPTPVDQFLTETPNRVEAGEIFEESPNAPGRTKVEELRFDDNTPLPDEFDPGVDSGHPAGAADAPAPAESSLQAEHPRDVDDAPVDIALGDPDDWADILGEFTAPLAAELAAVDEVVSEDAGEAAVAGQKEAPLDMDTQFALQAEAMGLELSGVPLSQQDDAGEHHRDQVDETGEVPQLDIEAANEDGGGDADQAPLVFGSIEKAMAGRKGTSEVLDKNVLDREARARAEYGAHIEDDEKLPDDEPVSADAAEQHVPEPSEEEQTINRLIDRDLLSMAVEDDDGFASTIVSGEGAAESVLAAGGELPQDEEAAAGFESIIMEGESVRTALGQEKLKADIAAAAELVRQAKLARAAEASSAATGRAGSMAAAAFFLALLLAGQVLHQYREALATIPAFNDAVGPLYRAIGMPLSPAWDVTGWRFEARRDILDQEADTLTVISRLGNTAAKALPYPLINISLTDRFEETVGNKTLDPGDYLTDDLDPGKLVQPGNNFTAVMSIESPAENATGYKLQACYRQPDAKLRCHVPNFK